MRKLNKVTKKKEHQLFQLDGFDELQTVDFKSLIPKEAKKIEVHYSQRNNILKVDYILELIVE